jgi:membrane protein implicated in regulation of membrane protease activity
LSLRSATKSDFAIEGVDVIILLATVFTLAVGVGAAFLVSLLIRIWFPSLAMPAFLILSLLWLRLGWRYAKMRDRREI